MSHLTSSSSPHPLYIKDISVLSELNYDSSTYFGRCRLFASMTDPRLLFTSSEQLKESQLLVEKVQKRLPGWQNIIVKDYQFAQQQLHAIIHPDTKQAIIWPFRFSSFLPINLCMLSGMLHPSQQTPWRGIFWQWMNQTYNAGFNYCNGSGSTLLSTRDICMGYTVACSTACGLSFILNRFAENLTNSSSSSSSSLTSKSSKFTLRLLPILKMSTAYTAVACANIANISVMRMGDIIHGIPVQDNITGEEIANGIPSRIAGQIALAQVALSRILIPLPLLLLPPFIMEFLFGPGRPLMPWRKKLFMPINIFVITSILSLALPLSIAVFPQETVMPVTKLESIFQGLKNSRGEEVTMVRFNKGM